MSERTVAIAAFLAAFLSFSASGAAQGGGERQRVSRAIECHSPTVTAAAGRKIAVMTLIDREGDVKTVKVPDTRKDTLQALARPIVDRSANIVTDAHLSYTGIDEHFHSHHTVDHSKTFVRGVIFHTNFAESYHSLLKRGIIGAFHHVSDKHLPRYLAEFDRRWNTRKDRDGVRAVDVISTAFGKRLTYKVATA